MHRPLTVPEGRIGRLRRAAGLDFHVLATLLLRSWSVLAGGLMVVFVPVWFSRVEQGYYYTFASLLALQVFFELGVNQVVMQVVGHEAAHLTQGPGGVLDGPPRHLGRLASVVRLLHRWYLAAAVLFALGVGVAGSAFFHYTGELPASQWQAVWALLVLATAVNLYLSPMLAVLEGCGRVGEIARLRLAQSVIGYLLMWLGLALGLGLWAMPALPIAAAAYTLYWLRTQEHPLGALAAYRPADASHAVDWRTEVLPFQWRIALSWISGYFIFQIFTPLTFARHGAEAAGRLGIALSVFTALLTLGMSWVNARLPAFAGHVARGERGELNTLFGGVLKRSLVFTSFTCTLVLAGVAGLHALGLSVAERIAPLPVLACLAAVTVANTFVSAAATYMRAHKEEPMLPVSVVTGVLVLAAAWFGSRHGVLPMMGLYAAVTLLVALPWTARLYAGYRARA